MSTKPSSSKQTSTSYTPEQKYWLGEALGTYGPQIGAGQAVYPGETVAGFSPWQESLLQTGYKYGELFQPDRTMPLAGETTQALSGLLQGRTGATNITPQMTGDYFRRVFEDPAKKAWAEDIRPAISEAYAGPGYWSSARAGAQLEGAQDLSDWLGTQRGQLGWDVMQANRAAEEAKAQRALSAVPMGFQAGMLPTQEAQQRLAGTAGVFDFLGVEQAQRQAETNAAIDKWQAGERLTDPEVMQIMMGLLGMSYTTERYRETGPGLGYSMLSGAAQGAGEGAGAAGMAALIASDIAVKENILPVKNALEKIRKLSAYAYNYIGQTRRHIGLMAQDVEKVLPEAVVSVNGIKHVNLYAIQSLVVAAINELLGGAKNA